MKTFIDDDFLLRSEPARILYHDYAESMPIFDYHCHLDPEQILRNHQFENLTEAWLSDDHYKWRLLRANAVEEAYITGNAPAKEKFLKWADTLSRCVGNPLYHWSNLELVRYFGAEDLLSPETAESIWELANRQLRSETGRVRSLICKSNVRALCTTDDPVDDLLVHKKLAGDSDFPVRVLPAFRPDKALHPENPEFADYIGELSAAVQFSIGDIDALKAALESRAEYFKQCGCRLSDHSFSAPDFTCCDEYAANTALRKALRGELPTRREMDAYQSELLSFLGATYHRLDFTMQLHLGVSRNLNSTLYRTKGPDMGGDAIGEQISTASLVALLDRLHQKGALPRTILYTLNPADMDKLMTVAGCFQDADTRCKIQVGSAWWYNDNYDGMERQMKTLANLGILSGFIGMLTDSRSFLSYARHEYFRRVLCNLLGSWMAEGQAQSDYTSMGAIVRDICYNNAVRYIGL